MARRARIFRLPMNAPDDLSAVKALFSTGKLDPQQIVAILSKPKVMDVSMTLPEAT